MIRLAFLALLAGAPAFPAEPSFVYSATFAYPDYPRDLWAVRLTQLKDLGFNAVQLPAGEADSELLDLLWRLRLPAKVEPPPPAGARSLGSDPARRLSALHEALLGGARAVNCSGVVEGRTPPEHEPAIDIAGDLRPPAEVLARIGALVRGFGPLLSTLQPRRGPGIPRWVGTTKPPARLRLGLLASTTPRGPAFVSAVNVSEKAPVTATLSLADPRTGRPLILPAVILPPRQALLMPVNLPLAQPQICTTCVAFQPEERLVSATTELHSIDFENGVLAFEFFAPSDAEMVLELAKQPRGPVITAGRFGKWEWNEKTRRLRLQIPAGKPPDFRSRVGLGVELPETSVFLKAPPRLILGSTAVITASFSSPELAARARLVAPSGWRVRPESEPGSQVTYNLNIPADAIPGDRVTLAVEAEGEVAHSLSLPVAQFCSLRIEPEETLHPRPGVLFPIRPGLAAVVLPRRRPYRIRLRNHYDEIKTFELTAAGDGLQFSSSRIEVPIGAGLEREINLTVWPPDPKPGLYRWTLTVREGLQEMAVPLALAVVSPDQSFSYSYDLDRDGYTDWVLENAKVRLALSPQHGGRMMEFLLKDRSLNAFSGSGALGVNQPLEARVLGPGELELTGPGFIRRISLGPGDTAFEIRQTGGPAEWVIRSPIFDASDGRPRLRVAAPGAAVVLDAKSRLLRIRFPESGPRQARFAFER